MEVPDRAAQEPVSVLVAPVILEELGEWSKPIRVRVERQADGTFEMIARTYQCGDKRDDG